MRWTVLALFLSSLVAPAASAQGIKGQKEPLGTTRVAIVNVGLVFSQYEKARNYKAALEELLKKPRLEAKTLVDDIASWEKQSNKENTSPAAKDRLVEKIRIAKRRLEDLNHELTRKLGKKAEENLVALWTEIQSGIRTCAVEQKIDVVIGYGDPIDKETLDLFPNVTRKMEAMDKGSGVPLFVNPRADISQAVVDRLNKRFREAQKNPKKPPIDF
jgi:Skp family chaperone for outer membrane proteins